MDSRHRSRRRRLALLVPVIAVGVAAAPVSRAQVPVPTAPPTASTPSCNTVDGSGQPATLFAPGDRVVVHGEGFGLVSAIRVTFVQGARTLPIALAYSDELGVFSTEKTDSRIPTTAAPGPASIHAFSTTKVTQCAVQVMASAGGSVATPKPHKKRSLPVLVWWAALAAFGVFLLIVVIRRWRAKRLASKVGKAEAAQPAPEEQEPEEPAGAETHDDDAPVLEEAPRPLLRPADEATSVLAPILDEPPAHAPPPYEPTESPPAAPPPVELHKAPVLDLLPENEHEDGEDEDDIDLEPESALPPPSAAHRPEGGDELEEFVYRDGKWRLRDEMQPRPAHPSGVDVGDASEVADALHVPELRGRPDDEPPLLDPAPVPESDVEGEAPRPTSPPPPPAEGTVSDTVARLVENTKDWTKR